MFKGFETANKKKVEVSKQALIKSKIIFDDINHFSVKDTQKSFGFQTANNEKVIVSEQSLAKSRQLFHDIDCENNINAAKVTEKSITKDNFGFKTGSNKDVRVSDDAFAITKKVFAEKDIKKSTVNKNIELTKDFETNKDTVHLDNILDTQVMNDFKEDMCTEDFSCKPIKRSGSPILMCPKAKKKRKFETPYTNKLKITEENNVYKNPVAKKPTNITFRDDYKKNKKYALKDLTDFEKDKIKNIDPYILNFNLENMINFEFDECRNDFKDGKMNIDDVKHLFIDATDAKLIPDGWLDIHLKLIIWKLISYEIKFRNTLEKVCTVKNVIDQLKYRYDKELYNAERPVLRKILEKDDVPNKNIMVLCVAAIFVDGVSVISATNLNNVELLVTDGWYFMLSKLVYDGKIVVGSKIVTCGAELLNCEQGVAPWEVQTMDSSCQVVVQEGILQGKECKTFYGKKYYSFEGIPYAKPPIGNLRFRNPEPLEPWTGIYDATKPGNKALQANPYSSAPIDGSEDCLYLNVYTPVLPAERIEKLPVVFFIHGGRLIFGHGNYYTPDLLLKHDVILVTINYRLNILGWICLNIPECPGNVGLKDAAIALRWVNRNISNFNGDPQNVTVSGESAGGAMATSFLTSKMTEGLYSKLISQSGNSITDVYLIEEDSVLKAVKVAEILGKNLTDKRDLYNFLVHVPADELIIAYAEAELSKPRSVLNAFFLPVVEKNFDGVEPFLTEHPKVAIRENRFHKVPILQSTNAFEGVIFFNENGKVVYENDFYYFIPQYAKIKRGTPKAKIIEDKLRKFYIGDKDLDDSVKTGYIQLVSDAIFWRDIIYFAEYITEYWDQFYQIQFNYSGNLHTRVLENIGVKGATHGDMIQYQFYRKNKMAKATKKDLEVVEMLTECICNFTKNGKPSWTNQPVEWVPYTREQKWTLMLDDKITLVHGYGSDRLKFWKDLEKDYDANDDS